MGSISLMYLMDSCCGVHNRTGGFDLKHICMRFRSTPFPKDKQNVPVTVRLLKALAGLVDPSMNNAVQPTMLSGLGLLAIPCKGC